MRRPPEETPATRHEDDLYSWVEEQVALLRAGRLDAIDALNIAEELADVGRSEFRSLVSAIAVLTQHLLKWDHQPDRRSRSWAITIRQQRREIAEVLSDSPGLKSRMTEAIERGYTRGRDDAIGETDLPEATLPQSCPYSFDDIMTRQVEFEGSRSRAAP